MIEQRPTVTLHPRNVASFLGAIALFLLVAHLIGLLMKHIIGHDYVYGLVPFFDLDTERNAPNFFSTCLFLINAALFLSVWKAKRVTSEPQRIWLFLSGLFCFLAIDEFFWLHERLVQPVRFALDTSGFFYFAWIIPYGIAVVLLSIFVIPVLWRMDRRIRFLFGLSAATYIAGAVGFEMIGGKYFEMMNGGGDIVYGLIITFEESLEMVGLIMLVYTLLSLVQSKYGGFLILIPGAHDASPPSNKSLQRTSENAGG